MIIFTQRKRDESRNVFARHENIGSKRRERVCKKAHTYRHSKEQTHTQSWRFASKLCVLKPPPRTHFQQHMEALGRVFVAVPQPRDERESKDI